MIARLIAPLLAALLLWSCDEEGPRIDVESSIPVRVETVARQPIAEYVTATGTVEARQEAQLRCLHGGLYQLQANPRTGEVFAMGDRVAAGELLALLVNPELVNQVGIDSKKLAFTSAQREFEKQQALFEKGGITLREVAEAERAYIDARYALENAELQLVKLEVRAPFAGRLVDLTHYGANELLEAGAAVGVVMDYDQLYAEVSLPGKEIDRISPEQAALVTHYGAATTDTLQGRIDQVSPVLDRESRMFKVTLAIANDSLAMRPGMFVKVDIVVAAKDSALVIPKEIVLDRGDSKTVFVVEKGIALERRLETGLSNRDQIEVLSGLEVEDRLVVEGFETLRDRSKVKITNEAAGAAR
ncbi:efflux RND transporter periplasmic adaptor subunit [Candidatus Latescibacterota bacterium]